MILLRYPRVLIGAGLVLALLGWLWWHDRQIIAQDRLESAVEAQRMDAIADDVAGQVAASQAAQIERTNQDAREAANAGTDPLGDGLRQLRTGKARDSKATR